MSYIVDNAIIMAAGTSSRFVPLSYEIPKALIEVRGEILIERQIRQIQEAGISPVYIVVGYKKEQFYYLREKFGVIIIENDEYLERNNNSSIYAVKDILKNSYICSADNYFSENPFEREVREAYYAAVFADGDTDEWCMSEDQQGYISSVSIGGHNSWYMLGHVFWDEAFSTRFTEILEEIYQKPETAGLLWESIFAKNLDTLKMKMRKYPAGMIFEFDTLDELRQFDSSYISNTRSQILKSIAEKFCCDESEIVQCSALKNSNNAADGFTFCIRGCCYTYTHKHDEGEKKCQEKSLRRIYRR